MMRRRIWSSNAGAALLLLMLPLLSGCTVLGFGVGWIADCGTVRYDDVRVRLGVLELDEGDSVTCVMKNGKVIAGTYIGVGLPDSTTATYIESPIQSSADTISPPYEDRKVKGLFERRTVLRMRKADRIQEIDTLNIRALRMQRSSWTSRTVLTLVGLAIDAALVIWFAATFEMRMNWSVQK